MSSTPGARMPSESSTKQVQVLEAEESGPDSTGTTEVGGLTARDATITEVRVDGDVSDYDFNVNFNGNAVFSSNQSPAGTDEESFVPDSANKRVGGSDTAQVTFEITSAGSAGTVQVLVEVEHQS
jgi:hypothetical protein